MITIDKIKEYDLIILPNDRKEKLLKEISNMTSFIKTKWMSLEEFKAKVLYTYDRKAIWYVMNRYQVKYEIANIYLQNTYYVEEKHYQNQNLNFLVALKKELQKQQLWIEDSYFKHYIRNKKIGMLGYYFLSSFEESLLLRYQVDVLETLDLERKQKIPLYHFSTLEEEVDFIANQMLLLLEQEIPIERLKIVNVTKEYEPVLKRIFSFYHIPLSLKKKTSLFSTNIGTYFIEHYQSDADQMLNMLKQAFSFQKEKEIEIHQLLISILNEYTWCHDLEEVKDLVLYDLRHTYLKEKSLKYAVEVKSLEEVESDDYVFLVGCNQGVFPQLYKDEDYINDQGKREVLLDDTKTRNMKEHDKACALINRLEHVTITYKDKTPFNTYYPSSILNELEVENGQCDVSSFPHYSRLYDQMKLTKKLDLFYKYGEISPDLGDYYHNFPQIPYKTYQNQYQTIDQETLFHRLNNRLILSYSTLDSYNRCAFRYYVNRILKCDPYEETFSQYIGNLCHAVLAEAFYPPFHFQKSVENFRAKSNYQCSKKEEFFLQKVLLELKDVIDIIKEQMTTCKLLNWKTEEKVEIPMNDKIDVTFMGIIDKILYQEIEDKTYAAIVDYKTGFPHIELKNLPYGIDMQLPIYLYLVYHLKDFKNLKLIGFYLQKILTPEGSASKTKTYIEQKREALRLTGYTTSNEEMIALLDCDYQNSKVIKGMKVSKNGFYPYTKVLSEQELEKLYRLIEQKIKETIHRILSGDFTINPKVIGDKNVGCEFCSYRDICFYQEDDKIHLPEYKDLSFLGGDKDA